MVSLSQLKEPPASGTTGMCWVDAPGAACLHGFQWGPSPAKVQSVNSIGTVTLMVLLTPHRCTSPWSLSSATAHICAVIVSMVGATLHLLQCNTCTLPPSSFWDRARAAAGELLLLWATIMASHVTYHVVFLVRNHSCKVDFSSLHFLNMLPSILHTIFLYIISNKMKKICLWFLIDWVYV